ncbi:MAG: hypothetical protein NUV47_03095 [Patescibacteria group bacterium]|nr:hypothetical protein [Patescibacteria group bacterium]
MTPEEREILEETASLAKENNVILKKMQRSARWGRVMQYGYWIVIILFSFGAYVAIKPYVNQLTAIYSGTGIEDILK